MPVTMYKSSYINQVDFLDMSMQAGLGRTYKYFKGDPIFPFGHGLSYTSFSIDLEASSPLLCTFTDASETCEFGIKVVNLGNRSGDEVVMMFMKPTSVLGEKTPSLPGTPVMEKKLLDFQRLNLDAKSTELLQFTLQGSQLALVDVSGNRVLISSNFDIIFSRGNYGKPSDIRIGAVVKCNKPKILSKFNYRWW